MKLPGLARKLAATAPWLLPASRTKNQLLNRLGHDIDPTAKIGPVLLVNVGRVEVGPDGYVGAMSVFKGVSRIRVARNAVLGGWNLVSGATELADTLTLPSELVLEESACVTTRHTIDCSAPVTFQPFSILAGHGSQVLTHSIDLRRNAQSARPVTIGERTFVSTRVTLLGGSSVPGHSVVAAGAVVTGGEHPEGSLLAGVPAKQKAQVSGDWFVREQEQTNDVFDPETGVTTPHAF